MTREASRRSCVKELGITDRRGEHMFFSKCMHFSEHSHTSHTDAGEIDTLYCDISTVEIGGETAPGCTSDSGAVVALVAAGPR